jgi:hypothetical protein
MTLPDIKFQVDFTEKPLAGKKRSSDGATKLDVNIDASPLPTGAATEAKQDSGNATLVSIDSKITYVYATNHFDDYTTTSVTYIGQETSTGLWKIIKIDETGNFPVFTYASLNNNPTLTTYALAWAARVTATYNIYEIAF